MNLTDGSVHVIPEFIYSPNATPPREDYVRRLEEERDLLEQQLRRLEREIDELRRVARPAQEST